MCKNDTLHKHYNLTEKNNHAQNQPSPDYLKLFCR